jgi:hypothetical protein
MINERVADLGYLALIKETVKGTPLTPTAFIPMYDDGGMGTDLQLDEINPAIGTKFARYSSLMGLRIHGGSPTLMATPNSAAYLMDMLMTKGTVTTPNYTYPFTLDKNTNPKSYTVDISNGMSVSRFMGVEASELKPVTSKNEVRFQPKLSALHSFIVREIATVGTGTLTLSTKYDPTPNFGLVVGDSIQFTGAGVGQTPVVVAVATVNVDGVTVTYTGTATGLAAGDFVALAPQTVSLVAETPFMWARTEFHFGATVTAALAASHTPCEQSSEVTLMHKFEKDGGDPRSGSFDPAALVRTTGDATAKIKRFFASQDELNRFAAAGQNPQAMVIKLLSGTAYEFRIVLDQIVYKTAKTAIKSGSIVYQEFDILPVYNVANAEGMSALVTCGIASL